MSDLEDLQSDHENSDEEVQIDNGSNYSGFRFSPSVIEQWPSELEKIYNLVVATE